MHLKRWITSIVALPFLVLLLCKGGSFLFAVFISVVAIIALWEYFRIQFDHKIPVKLKIIPFFGFFTGSFIVWAVYSNYYEVVLGILIFNFIISAFISVFQYKHDPFVLEIVIKQIIGILYIPLFLSCLVMIRNVESGVDWIFFLLCIVFAGDVGAYYTGISLGRHKLCPAVSPGKTVEGSIGGLAANLLTGSLFKFFFLPSLPWLESLLFFALIGVAGQAGDLFESELKRTAKVKDSGGILPGHGGILDRIDALLFAAPLAYFFKEYILGP